MFGNFFGIVIISASALLITGLIIRSVPDLPAKMNLGIVDNTTIASQPSTDSDNSTTKNDTSQTTAPVADKTETQAETKPSPSAATQQPIKAIQGVSKEYLDIRQRAVEISGSAATRANKSDANKYKDN